MTQTIIAFQGNGQNKSKTSDLGFKWAWIILKAKHCCHRKGIQKWLLYDKLLNNPIREIFFPPLPKHSQEIDKFTSHRNMIVIEKGLNYASYQFSWLAVAGGDCIFFKAIYPTKCVKVSFISLICLTRIYKIRPATKLAHELTSRLYHHEWIFSINYNISFRSYFVPVYRFYYQNSGRHR